MAINSFDVFAEHCRFGIVLRVGAPHPSDCGRVLGHHLRRRHQGLSHPDQDRAGLPAINMVTDQTNPQEHNDQTVLLAHDLRSCFGINFINIVNCNLIQYARPFYKTFFPLFKNGTT